MYEDKILIDKKILLFAPSFFNYEKQIKEKLEELGASVTFFDERPSNSTFGKAIIRTSKKISHQFINTYYKKIETLILNKYYDYVIFFQAEATPSWFLKKISQMYSDSKKILYLWDSVIDKPNSLENRKFYDVIYTFDPYDAKMYSLRFRPLFFVDSYNANETKSIEHSLYDFSFIGTVRRDRYKILEDLKINAKSQKQTYYVYYYLQSKIMYLYFKYIRHIFPKSLIKDFSFSALSHLEIQDIIKNSKIIIDIQKPNQVGLTIRTIELLASKKKFVTTNNEICKYDFYNENINVLDRKTPMINIDFMNQEFNKIDESILTGYTLRYFLLELMEITPRREYYKY
jgi:hypothetical protein